MLPEKMVKARLSFVAGKHTQEPNLVLVPAGATSFPVTVEWSMQAETAYVIGSPEAGAAHRWCVLDSELKQVMHGAVQGGRKVSRKLHPAVSRTLHGGGADNPRQVTLELSGDKLEHGAAYTLIASRHGLIAAGEFVVVHEPIPEAAAKKRPAAKARKAVARAKRTASRAKKGVARAKKGVARAKKGAARAKRGAARAKRGAAKAKRGAAKARKAVSKAKKLVSRKKSAA